MVSYSYFPAGQVSNVTSVAGTFSYFYDEAERISQIESSNDTFTYSYNPCNGLVSNVAYTISTNLDVAYTYDDLDRVTKIIWDKSKGEGGPFRELEYEYNSVGMITSVVQSEYFQLSSRTAYTYDELDRLTGEKRLNSSSETLYEIGYSYDEVGNRTQKTQNGVTVSYSYSNGCNRLTGWTATSTNDFADLRKIDIFGYSSETIGINSALGQLYVSNSVSGSSATPSVSGINFEYSAFSVVAGTQQLVAAIGDVAGNVEYATNTVVVTIVTNADYEYNSASCITNIKYAGTGGYTNESYISWNSQYQITSVSTNGALTEVYQYDGLGRRTRIVTGATTNYLVYDGIHVVAEVNTAGQLQKSYTLGSGGRQHSDHDHWLWHSHNEYLLLRERSFRLGSHGSEHIWRHCGRI